MSTPIPQYITDFFASKGVNVIGERDYYAIREAVNDSNLESLMLSISNALTGLQTIILDAFQTASSAKKYVTVTSGMKGSMSNYNVDGVTTIPNHSDCIGYKIMESGHVAFCDQFGNQQVYEAIADPMRFLPEVPYIIDTSTTASIVLLYRGLN